MRRDVISAITVTEQIRCLISRKLCPLTIVDSPPGHAQPYEIGDVGLSYDTPKLSLVTLDAETRNGSVHSDAATLLRKHGELTDCIAITGGNGVHRHPLRAAAAADRIDAIGKHDLRASRCMRRRKLRRRQALIAPRRKKDRRSSKDYPIDQVIHCSILPFPSTRKDDRRYESRLAVLWTPPQLTKTRVIPVQLQTAFRAQLLLRCALIAGHRCGGRGGRPERMPASLAPIARSPFFLRYSRSRAYSGLPGSGARIAKPYGVYEE